MKELHRTRIEARGSTDCSGMMTDRKQQASCSLPPSDCYYRMHACHDHPHLGVPRLTCVCRWWNRLPDSVAVQGHAFVGSLSGGHGALAPSIHPCIHSSISMSICPSPVCWWQSICLAVSDYRRLLAVP